LKEISFQTWHAMLNENLAFIGIDPLRELQLDSAEHGL
jgi:hypothetical protein